MEIRRGAINAEKRGGIEECSKAFKKHKVVKVKEKRYNEKIRDECMGGLALIEMQPKKKLGTSYRKKKGVKSPEQVMWEVDGFRIGDDEDYTFRYVTFRDVFVPFGPSLFTLSSHFQCSDHRIALEYQKTMRRANHFDEIRPYALNSKDTLPWYAYNLAIPQGERANLREELDQQQAVLPLDPQPTFQEEEGTPEPETLGDPTRFFQERAYRQGRNIPRQDHCIV
jgi:hypothetical protein